jgi:predicted 3-demethylubiquinone-9 3-methyltransferase (glyoxalase superfamily)
VDFTVAGIPCLGLNGRPHFKHSEAFSFQIATDNQAETDRLWNAVVGNGGQEIACMRNIDIAAIEAARLGQYLWSSQGSR